MPFRPALLSATLACLVLSGCSSGPSDDGATRVDPVQYEDGLVQVQAPETLPRDPPAAGERTLEEAPQWRLGEWWTYTLSDGFTGQTYEFTRVVAGVDEARDIYLVGFGAPTGEVSIQGEFPTESFSNDILIFHIPGFGDVSQSDLSYETHDAVFKPLDFPLRDGSTWDMSFEGVATGSAVVTVNADGTASIDMGVTNYGSINATYDPEVGEITRMDIGNGGYATYEITGHGYGFKGLVRVPHDHDLVFNNGRIGALPVGGSPPEFGPAAGPNEEVTIEGIYDRISFIVAVGGGALTGLPTQGYFSEKVTAPDNTVYEASLTPAEIALGTQLKIIAIGHDSPQGTWLMEHVAAGAGVAFVEGIAYHSIDFDLPSGCVIQSFNAEHHGTQCKIGADQSTAGAPGNATVAG